MIWYIYSLLAALLLTTAVLLQKKNLKQIHALEFSTETSFYGLILAFFLLPWVEWNFGIFTYLLIALQGVLSVFAYLLFNKALRHSDISEVSPLINLDTITTLAFAALLLYEFPTKVQILGIGFIFIGAYFLELKSRHHPLSPLRAFTQKRGLIFLLASTVLAGFDRVLVKIILSEISPITLIFFVYLIFFLGFLILDWFSFKENITKLRSLLKTHGLSLFWTSLSVFAYRLVATAALSLGSVSLVTAIARTSTFFTALAGGKLFSENNLRQKTISALVILIGVLLIIL